MLTPQVQRPRLRPFFVALGYPIFVAMCLVVGGSFVRDCEESTPAPVPTGGCSPKGSMYYTDGREFECLGAHWQETHLEILDIPDAGVPDAAPPDAAYTDVLMPAGSVNVMGKLVVGTGCHRVEIMDGMVNFVTDLTVPGCEPDERPHMRHRTVAP